MQFKVVIIDKDPLTARFLAETIDWEALNCVIAGMAYDGEEGKQLILRAQPDILLTDICLPKCDGLDMIEAVRSRVPDCKTIILTVYDQFEYTGRAIRLAVFDYLLKPVQPDMVAESVIRAADEIRQHRDVTESIEQIDRVRQRAQLLSLLTNPSQKGDGVHQIIEDLNLVFGAYYVMTIQLKSEETFSQASLNQLDRIIASRQVKSITCLLYDMMVAFVMRPAEDALWREEAEQLARNITKETEMPVQIGISKQHRSMHEIRQAYQQSRQAMWVAALMQDDGSSVVFYSSGEEKNLPNPRIADYNTRMAALMEKAELSDESAREAARELVKLSGHQYSQLRATVAMYSLELRSKFGAPSDLQTDIAMQESWFVTLPEEVEGCLLKMCAALRSSSGEKRYSLLTQNALQYIQLHAADDLQLSIVAEKMCVSGNYLSSLIRKETGITYHEHVLNAKMAVARTMLADPRILVEEVARAIGYRNYVSFYNAFKRVEHMTPTEYRNRKVKV